MAFFRNGRELGVEPSNSGHPQRRWLRFSLRTWVVFITILAVWLGWRVNHVREIRDSARTLDKVGRDHGSQFTVNCLFGPGRTESQLPERLMRVFGEDFFATGLTAAFDAIDDDSLEEIATAVALHDLQISGLRYSDTGMSYIARLPRLQSLVIIGGDVTDASVEHFMELRNLKQLQLCNTQLTDAGLQSLSSAMPETEILSNRNEAVDLSGYKGVPGPLGLNGFKNVTDESLANLKQCPDLAALYIAATSITDVGLQHLAGLSKIEELALDGTRITDAGLEHLRELRSLRKLSLRRTAVTQTGVANLQKSLPECEIVR